ncbi:MAG: tRNA 2-thiouridine(34) synthase MnmA [Candidatus Schekmanbacteria bacterium]|nr:tRNA 2-thiouridine(34) synthase MnmA [Candidatus Schekmanbacteria bacterium]
MRVAVAMSGGVDSSVAASLLREQGHEVIGLTATLAPPGTTSAAEARGEQRCCAIDDVADARRVADVLAIPHYVLNLREQFGREVLTPFIADYLTGRTPSPCVRCNQLIKWGALLARALALGAEALATGHYARRELLPHGGARLARGRDRAKDQSYFLSLLSAHQIERTVFPLGELTKGEVRELAQGFALPVAAKPESQEVCFVPSTGHGAFVSSRPEAAGRIRPGALVDTRGKILGRHHGIHAFTIGQRKGLGISLGQPAYVVDIRADAAEVVVGSKDDLCALGFTANGLVWNGSPIPEEGIHVSVQVRYRAAPVPALLTRFGADACVVRFVAPQRAIAPGQLAAFYEAEAVLGGAWIESRLSR